MEKINKKLITHDGSFHADDVFACATLSLLLEKRGESFEVIRTRDEEIINSGNYVFDVGGIYNPDLNKFDHHQKDFNEKRNNNIIYSSFGLIWKKYGEELCGDIEIVKKIDEKIVQPIDAGDNGIDLCTFKYDIKSYTIQSMFYAFRPSWNEGTDFDTPFLEMVNFAKKILSREIKKEQNTILGNKKFAEFYDKSENKKIIVLDDRYPLDEVTLLYPEVLFVINPRPDGNWNINTIRKNQNSFENRKDLPREWSALRDLELQKITGVNDAIFCHRALFLAVAKSHEGALQLAELALKN